MPRDPIVDPQDLPSLGPFHLLDARDPAAFALSHPARAVRVPLETWEAAAKSGETSFENVAYWAQAIGALGVSAVIPAIVYDDGRMTEAARVWFILQYFGVAAKLLNGGWPTLQSKDDVLAGAIAPLNSVTFDARPGAGPVGIIDRHALRSQLDDVRIFDARTSGEFNGTDLRRNARGGHLPGATLVPHADLLDRGQLKSPGELRRLLAEAGFVGGDHVVTHCDGGGRAALAAAAAVRAGFNDFRAYYLSFADWTADESCPVVQDPPGAS